MKKNTFERIRVIVQKIPKGKVASYGQIAKLAGISNPRVAGWALRGCEDKNIPCHRVVKVDGSLAKEFGFGGPEEQKNLLLDEGITFVEKFKVDMKRYSWKA